MDLGAMRGVMGGEESWEARSRGRCENAMKLRVVGVAEVKADIDEAI